MVSFRSRLVLALRRKVRLRGGWGSAAAFSLLVTTASASAQTRVELEHVAEARAPIELVDVGEGSLLVAQLGGEIRVLDRSSGTFALRPFLDLSREVSQGEQQGLFSLALHPSTSMDATKHVARRTDIIVITIYNRLLCRTDPHQT